MDESVFTFLIKKTASRKSFFRTDIPAQTIPNADRSMVEAFSDWTDSPDKADFAIVFIESPLSDGYDARSGYLPISLQYRPYKAINAREHSLAQGDFREESLRHLHLYNAE